MTDAEKMKKVRKDLGITQAELAEKMGYQHKVRISEIERGEKQMSNQARKLLAYIEKYVS